MSQYSCAKYRAEMILLSLKNRLAKEDLNIYERQKLKAEIKQLEAEIGIDSSKRIY